MTASRSPRLWPSAQPGAPPPAVLLDEWPADRTGLCALTWSPDGEHLASGGNGGSIELWRAADDEGWRRERVVRGHRGSVRALAFSPDGRRLASGAEDGEVLIWDLDSSRCERVQTVHGWVNAVAWSPAGDRLAAGGGGRTVVVTGGEQQRILPSPYGVVLALDWSPDSSLLAMATRSPFITLWETGGWTLDRTLRGGPGAMWAVAWRDRGTEIVGAGSGGRLTCWTLPDGRVRGVVDAHGGVIARASPAARGGLLATLSHDQTSALWDLDCFRLLGRLAGTYPGWSGCLELHPQRSLLATTDSTGCCIQVWSTAPLPTAAPIPDPGPHRVAEHRLVAALVSELRSQGARVVPTATLAEGLAARRPGLAVPHSWARTGVAQLADLPDPGVLVTAGGELVALTPAEVEGHAEGLVCGATPSPDGRLEVTGGRDIMSCAAHLLVATRRGWSAGSSAPARLHLPELACKPAPGPWHEAEAIALSWPCRNPAALGARLQTDLVDTTLFRRWALVGSGLLLDGGGADALVWAHARHHGSLLTLTLAGGAPVPALAVLLAARAAREPHAGPLSQRTVTARLPGYAAPTQWVNWDPAAAHCWALPPEITSTGTPAVLDEQVDDERARRERLLDSALRDAAPRVPVWAAPGTEGAMAELRRELAVTGIRALAAGADGVGQATAAGIAVVLLPCDEGTGVGWEGLAVADAHAALLRRSRENGTRIRWLPVRIGDGPLPADLPDHLRSFDAYHWGPGPRAARRADLQALLGAIIVDRSRS